MRPLIDQGRNLGGTGEAWKDQERAWERRLGEAQARDSSGLLKFYQIYLGYFQAIPRTLQRLPSSPPGLTRSTQAFNWFSQGLTRSP